MALKIIISAVLDSEVKHAKTARATALLMRSVVDKSGQAAIDYAISMLDNALPVAEGPTPGSYFITGVPANAAVAEQQLVTRVRKRREQLNKVVQTAVAKFASQNGLPSPAAALQQVIQQVTSGSSPGGTGSQRQQPPPNPNNTGSQQQQQAPPNPPPQSPPPQGPPTQANPPASGGTPPTTPTTPPAHTSTDPEDTTTPQTVSSTSSSATVTTTGGGSTPDPETTGGGSGGGGGGSNGVAQGNSKPQPNNNSNPPSATQPSGTTPTGGGPNITDRQERVVWIIGGERPIGYLGGHVDPYTNSDGGGGGEVGPAPGHGPTPDDTQQHADPPQGDSPWGGAHSGRTTTATPQTPIGLAMAIPTAGSSGGGSQGDSSSSDDDPVGRPDGS